MRPKIFRAPKMIKNYCYANKTYNYYEQLCLPVKKGSEFRKELFTFEKFTRIFVDVFFCLFSTFYESFQFFYNVFRYGTYILMPLEKVSILCGFAFVLFSTYASSGFERSMNDETFHGCNSWKCHWFLIHENVFLQNFPFVKLFCCLINYVKWSNRPVFGINSRPVFTCFDESFPVHSILFSQTNFIKLNLV